MANAFDQFDGAPTGVGAAPLAAAPSASAPNPFDQFDSASGANPDTGSSPSPQATIGSVAKQAGLGLVSGIPHAAAGIADMLEKGTVDALTFSDPKTGENQFHQLARNLHIIGGDAPTTDASYVPTTGQDILNLTHVDDLPQPQNAPERVARGVGEGAIQMAAPLGALGDAGLIGNVARGVTVGGLSGGTSQTAQEAVPDKYKPLAGLVGGLAGGVTGEALSSIPGAVKSGLNVAGDYIAPLTDSGRQKMAGSALKSAATDPDSAVDAITNEPRNLVPGSNPTTFQLTGDMGLGRLERAVASKNSDLFETVRGEQNSARLDALNNIQEDGHPEAVSGFFRDQLSKIDSDTQAIHDAAEQSAQQQTAGLGGGRTPEAYGEDIKAAVNPQIDAATNTARNAAQQLGGGQPEVLGEQARSAVQSQLDEMKSRERALWSAVDPDGNLQTVASPIKQATQRIYGDMGPEAKLGMAPIESQIANVVSDYGQILPFQRLIDLRSAISQGMRDVRSPLQFNQPAYARLTQLRGAVEDAISDSVAHRAGTEQQAVAEGSMQPQDTLAARIAAERQKWYDDRALEGVREGTGNNAGRGSASFSRAFGTESQTGSRPGPNASSEDLSGQPFIDEEAANRLKAATQATAERKQTYGAKPVSQILQRPGNTQPYTMPSAGVTSSIWKPGNPGADTVRSTLQAAGNRAEAVESVRNMAAQSLRDKAPDGVVTDRIFNQWRMQHAQALQALEQASPGSVARFQNAARASEGLQRFDGYNPQTPSSVLPERYFAKGESGMSSVEDLRGLIGKDKADKLLSDYAADSLRKTAGKPDGTLDPSKFASWQKAHSGALRALPDTHARFLDAAKASENLATVAAQRRDALEAFQKTEAGKLLKVDDPADVVKTVGSIFSRRDSATRMKALFDAASPNPDAVAGLRKTIIQYMQEHLISNTEAGTSGRSLIKADQFQTFLAKNQSALAYAFPKENLNAMQAIAQDLKRANRSITSSKLPGQSNTAQDIAAKAHFDQNESLLSQAITHAIVSGAGVLGGGVEGGVAGFFGSRVFGAMRNSGLRKVSDLIREAMLDPDLAKALIMKAPRRPNTGSELTLAARLRNASMFGAIRGSAEQQ